MQKVKEKSNWKGETIVEIEIERLKAFRNHPFQVRDDDDLEKLKESIKMYGILTPLLVRPIKDGTYEIISGHRRKRAAALLGYRKIPVLIQPMSYEDAVVKMVDTNLHREHISFSEKAFAYRMKNEAMKQKVGRKKGQSGQQKKGKKTIEIIGEEFGDSPKQVQRYIAVTIDVCEDERLKLAINLAFSCTLRMGELLGLTWDCVDISTEAIEENRSYIFVNKEVQRIKKSSLDTLDAKDILYVFPSSHTKNTTLLVLKIPKTESSIRKVFLPRSVAEMLQKWKLKQLNTKAILGEEYNDYNLVMTSEFGSPLESGTIRVSFNKLIEEHHLPKVVFHSLRHSSVTYKLKLNKGDIKAVQGDSGHSQTDMVTDVYSHIIDEDRKKNAELFEDAFYKKNNLEPNMVSEEVDMELLMKALANPEMRALLNSLAKTMK